MWNSVFQMRCTVLRSSLHERQFQLQFYGYQADITVLPRLNRRGAVGMAYPGARPGGVDACVMKVELRIECHNLLNMDCTSLSDPCAVVSMQRSGKHWYEVGRTENIKNTVDPQFSKPFELEYYFEEVQKFKVDIFDMDNTTPQLNDDDFLGGIECTLGQIVSQSPYKKPLLLRNGHQAGKGTIILRAEELSGSNEHLLMDFSAKNLDSKDLMGKSDPFLEIHRMNPDSSTQLVHRTEVIKNNLNPNWRPFQIPLRLFEIPGGHGEYNLLIQCFDWDSDGSHDLIGAFNTNKSDLLQAMRQVKEWDCINVKKQAKKKNYKNSGIIILRSANIVKEYSFLEFIFGGLQLNFTVGIDFTGSNGNPMSPDSLHYMNPHAPNEYQQAIMAVGTVCQDYDTDKMFPALGFGARIPPTNQVSHEFAINFNPQNPFCAGVNGILDAYRNCIPQVQLYGPTNAAPIINHVARFAKQAQQEEQHAYFILLLLTDGVLTDMNETRHAIVEASRLPMSLIIVGVGNADFSDMEMLDGDDGVLRSPFNGRCVERDVVQFVPFRQFLGRPGGPSACGPELARHVLAEVPKQVVDYMKAHKIVPRAPANAM